MARRAYKNLPVELQAHAEGTATLLETRGFRVRSEHHEIGFPNVPTLHCQRAPVLLLVEVVDSLNHKRVDEWTAYCRAAGSDTRFALAMPDQAAPAVGETDRLRANGVGLYLASPAQVREILTANDQGMQGAEATLPALATLPRRVRQLLGPAYEKIGRGDWREAFKDACEVFEDAAKRYMKHWSGTTRIKVQRKAGPHVLRSQEIDRMTMGGLAHAFDEILSPTAVDSLVGQTLRSVFWDRNLATHKLRRATTEARLRRNWRGHFWRIVDALKAIA
jgi:hypothetical protein